MMGDSTQVEWDRAPEWQKESAINGVKAIIDNPIQTPEDCHEGWLAQKEADGWKYGEIKDAAKKEHPCFVHYSELPLHQRLKDVLFANNAKALTTILENAQHRV